MNKFLLTLAAVLATASVTFAGPMMMDGKSSKSFKTPMVDTPPPCIDAGEFVLGLFGAHAWVDSAEGDISESYDDGFGGGAELLYYPTRNFGIGAQYMAFGDAPIHLITGDIHVRFPTDCFAPYIIGSVGGAVDSQNVFVAGGGVGLEYRLTPKIGLFGDGRYLYAEEVDEIITVRAGLRFVF